MAIPPFQKILQNLINTECKSARMTERIVTQKLIAQGIKQPEKAAKAIAEYITKRLETGSDTSDSARFNFEEDSSEVSNVTLQFDAEDIYAYAESIGRAFGEVVPAMSRQFADVVLSGIKRRGSEQIQGRRLMVLNFEANLEQRWGKAFELYEIVLGVAQEAGAATIKHLHRRGRRKSPHLISALARMQARACQVSSEILALLRSGFADGAHARWRTLHEISVTSALLSEYGDALAERYVLHEIVESLRAAIQFNGHAEELGEQPISDRKLIQIEKDVEQLCERFGKNYRTPYGWAAEVVNNSKPTFEHLEQAANLSHLRPCYKLASYNIHASAKGAAYRLGAMNDRNLLLAGPSNAGLEESGHFTPYSLTQITLCLLAVETTMDDLVYGQMLITLSQEAEEKFIRIARRLKRDEANERSRQRIGGRTSARFRSRE